MPVFGAKKGRMPNTQKILTAGIGLAVLAGLAMHQGGSRQVTTDEQSILVGTALDAAAQESTARELESIESEVVSDACPPEDSVSAGQASELTGCAGGVTAENPPPPAPDSQPG